MAHVVADRVKETTTTTGTGTVTLSGSATGFQTFVAGVGDGNTTFYCITDGTDFEVGIGTVTAGGSDTLSRDTVLASTNGGAAVNFGAGTKSVFCDIPSARALFMNTSGTQVLGVPDGTAGAPGMAFGSDLDTGFFRPTSNAIGLAFAGDEDFRLSANLFAALAGSNVVVGKSSADSGANAGCEFNPGGVGFFTRDGAVPVVVNRLSDDGDLLLLRQDGTNEGTISVSGTTVTYGTFSGGHWAQWIGPDPDVPPGTVLSTTDEPYERTFKTLSDGRQVRAGRKERGAGVVERPKPQLVKVEVSAVVADKRVYGVFIADMDRQNDDEDGDILVGALGTYLVRVTGPCAGGDLLESNGDGTARAQADDIIRSSTIGKLSRGNPDAGPIDEMLLPAVVYCG